MLLVGCCCIFLIALTTVVHYEVLRGLSARLPGLSIPARSKLLVVIFATFIAHTLEIALYGLVPFLLVRYGDVGTLGGGRDTLVTFIYFSAETYSSLGYGDIIPFGPIRLFAGVEALNGLLLIGWSASYVYIAMERFWTDTLRG